MSLINKSGYGSRGHDLERQGYNETMSGGARRSALTCRTARDYRACAILVLCIAVHPAAIFAQHEQSLDAFVPAAHKTVFESHNLLVLGNLNLAKSSVQGPVAVSGRAQLEEFDINSAGSCNEKNRALTVGGRLSASMGAIRNGYTVVGRGSRLKHNVQLACSSRVERYDARRLRIRDFEEHRTSLIKESGDICVNPVSGSVEKDLTNSVYRFTPGNTTYSCYTVFSVSVGELASIRMFEFMGSNKDQNVLILLTGKYTTLRDFSMVGFNPVRTLLVFCSVYGHIELFNARIHASILAPTTEFTSMGTVMNGSLIASGLRGKIAVLYQPYVTC